MQRNIYNSVCAGRSQSRALWSEFLSFSTLYIYCMYGYFVVFFFFFYSPHSIGDNLWAIISWRAPKHRISMPLSFRRFILFFTVYVLYIWCVRVCVCLSLKSISLPFSRHITLPISLALSIYVPPFPFLSLSFHLYNIFYSMRIETFHSFELCCLGSLVARQYSISSSVVIILSRLLWPFSRSRLSLLQVLQS